MIESSHLYLSLPLYLSLYLFISISLDLYSLRSKLGDEYEMTTVVVVVVVTGMCVY